MSERYESDEQAARELRKLVKSQPEMSERYESDEQAAQELRKLVKSQPNYVKQSEFDPEWAHQAVKKGFRVTTPQNPDTLLGWISLLVPLVGVILGCVFIAKDRQEDKETGSLCLTCAICGFVLGTIIVVLLNIILSQVSHVR